MSSSSKIILTTAKGLVPYLLDELKVLGYVVVRSSESHVEINGSLTDTYKLNLSLRTAFHVLYGLTDFPCRTPDDLYRQALEFPWENWLNPDVYLSVTSTVDDPTINDSRFPNLRCKDAIVDRLRRKTGRRPDSGPSSDFAVVRLYWKQGRASLFIDTSGEPLTRRGYRKLPWKAPLQETLAAGIVFASNWNGEGHLVNPMCGSGTLAIEAALLALNRAPGLLRSNFGFKHIVPFEISVWQRIRQETLGLSRKKLSCKIIASDISGKAIDAAKKNAQTAGLDHVIEFVESDFAETPIPEGEGIVLMNPEYGLRMGEQDALLETYQRIGDFFKQKCSGYRGFVFSGNPELLKRVGLKASRRTCFFNAKIECRLAEYELYKGTRKQTKSDVEYEKHE